MLFPCLLRTRADSHPPPPAAQSAFVLLMIAIVIALSYGMRADLSVGVSEMQSEWSPGWTGWVLSSFFVGYFVGNIPGGLLAQRHGARTVLAAGVSAASAANAAVPLVARSPSLVIMLRMVCGLAQACTFPCAYQLLFAWTTPATRSRAVTLSMSVGSAAGTASGFVLSERARGAYGLQGCFGLWSAAGVVWVVAWLLLVPEIEHTASSSAMLRKPHAKPHVPWHALASQPTLVSLYAVHIAVNFINYGLLTQLPLFLTTALHASPATLVYGTTLPYLANVVLAAAAGAAADRLLSRSRPPSLHSCPLVHGCPPLHGGEPSHSQLRTLVRKGFTLVGVGGAGVLLAAASWASAPSFAVALVVAAYGIGGAAQAGWQALYLDAYGEVSGQAYSYSNTLATLAGIIAPLIASSLVSRLGEVNGYRATFFIFGPAVGLPALVFFCRVASADRARLLLETSSRDDCDKDALSSTSPLISE